MKHSAYWFAIALRHIVPTGQKLIDTALRLFRDDGYRATTMRRIATEAGVSLGNAYYYFASKDDLVHEL